MIPGYTFGTGHPRPRTFSSMHATRPTALLLVLALLAGTGALVPSAARAMGQGDTAAETLRSCCLPQAEPCATPCPPDDGRSLVESVLCCASGDRSPHEIAVAPEAPTRLMADVALAAAWLVTPLAPPATAHPRGVTRHEPHRPPVRSHLAVSVLLI